MARTPTIRGSGVASAQGYHIDVVPPHDNEAIRDRSGRWLNLIMTTAIVGAAPILLGTYMGSLGGSFPMKVGVLAGIGVAALLEIPVLYRMLIYNREWSAYVTQNGPKGTMVPYGPGLHPAHWWEVRNKRGNYPLDIITKSIEISVPTKSAQVIVEVSFQYMVDLAYITNFVGADDESTIMNGFAGFIESFVTEKFAEMDAEQVRAAIKEMNTMLAREFMGVTHDGLSPVDFEHKYGIKTVSIVLKGIKLSPAAQKTRDAIDEAENLNKVIAKLRGVEPEKMTEMLDSGKITREEFRDLADKALAASDNATMNINVNRIDIPQINQVIDAIVTYLKTK